MYLLRTGTFCAAFWFAIGFGDLIDEHAPAQVTHISIQSSLHFTHLDLPQSCTALLCCVSGISAFSLSFFAAVRVIETCS